MPRSVYSRFAEGLQIAGMPVNIAATAKVLYVCNNTTPVPLGVVGQLGALGKTPERPVSTINQALALVTAGRGDVILVAPGHTETISAAAGIALNVAGVSVIGLGEGSLRPVITFSATASTMTISAANVLLRNIIITNSIDQVVAGIIVSAADVQIIDVESRDNAANKEFVIVIQATSAAARLKVRAKHVGFVTGSHMTRYIDLVGVVDADIDVDFYGIASTAVVNMRTTACKGVQVRGRFHNGTTSITLNVVDNATSTWDANGYDGIGATPFAGSDTTAIGALSSVGTNATALGTNGTTVTDSAVTVLGAIGANNSANAFSSASVVNTRPTGSVLERLANIQVGESKAVVSAIKVVPQSTTTTVFTVTGGPILLEYLAYEVTTIVQTQACNFKFTSTDTASSTATDLCANLNITAQAVGTFSYVKMDALATALTAQVGGTGLGPTVTNGLVIPIGTVAATTSASNTGNIKYHIRWHALDPNASVTVA